MKKLFAFLGICLFLFAGMRAEAAPAVQADGTVFDAEYYAQNNPDVVAAFGLDSNMLLMHYNLCGKAEGRLAFAPGSVPVLPVSADTTVFDAVFYAQNNPDVVAVFGTDPNMLLMHYNMCGKAEGRLGATPGTTHASSTGNTVSTGSSSLLPPPSNTGNLVWVPTEGGKKYHYSQFCSGMHNPIRSKVEDAISYGFTACKKCT